MYTDQTFAGTREHDSIQCTQISLTSLTNQQINSRTNLGTSKGSETLADKYSTRQIWIFRLYFCSRMILKVILKRRGQNKFYKNIPGRSEYSSPRAFQWLSRKCRSTSGSLENWCFMCFYWGSNPAVCSTNQWCSMKIQNIVGPNWSYARKTRIHLHIAIIREPSIVLFKLAKNIIFDCMSSLFGFSKNK